MRLKHFIKQQKEVISVKSFLNALTQSMAFFYGPKTAVVYMGRAKRSHYMLKTDAYFCSDLNFLASLMFRKYFCFFRTFKFL